MDSDKSTDVNIQGDSRRRLYNRRQNKSTIDIPLIDSDGNIIGVIASGQKWYLPDEMKNKGMSSTSEKDDKAEPLSTHGYSWTGKRGRELLKEAIQGGADVKFAVH